ncbi:hypothetical protein GEV33_006602 [Tenebrio molitor]|uniref:Uncharacterized protein n=1 Tax=Tenebrio molitor TaxID=7067 RepID=A0A8J6HKY6_TENMO|nr:hypothetical protein GEV33_006602 [Tenebrio molitor]
MGHSGGARTNTPPPRKSHLSKLLFWEGGRRNFNGFLRGWQACLPESEWNRELSQESKNATRECQETEKRRCEYEFIRANGGVLGRREIKIEARRCGGGSGADVCRRPRLIRPYSNQIAFYGWP